MRGVGRRLTEVFGKACSVTALGVLHCPEADRWKR
jgi:hypothetical protein